MNKNGTQFEVAVQVSWALVCFIRCSLLDSECRTISPFKRLLPFPPHFELGPRISPFSRELLLSANSITNKGKETKITLYSKCVHIVCLPVVK